MADHKSGIPVVFGGEAFLTRQVSKSNDADGSVDLSDGRRVVLTNDERTALLFAMSLDRLHEACLTALLQPNLGAAGLIERININAELFKLPCPPQLNTRRNKVIKPS